MFFDRHRFVSEYLAPREGTIGRNEAAVGFRVGPHQFPAVHEKHFEDDLLHVANQPDQEHLRRLGPPVPANNEFPSLLVRRYKLPINTCAYLGPTKALPLLLRYLTRNQFAIDGYYEGLGKLLTAPSCFCLDQSCEF